MGWFMVVLSTSWRNSLLKISSVRLLVMVGNNCCSASVMVVVAAKSKFLVTSASKLAGGTFLPVGSRLFLKTICTVTVSRLLEACWLEMPDVAIAVIGDPGRHVVVGIGGLRSGRAGTPGC